MIWESEITELERCSATNFKNWKTEDVINTIQNALDDGKIPPQLRDRAINVIEHFKKIPPDGSFPGGGTTEQKVS